MKHRTPMEVRAQLIEWANDPLVPSSFNQKVNGANLGHLTKALPRLTASQKEEKLPKDFNRYLVLGYLFGEAAEPFRIMRSGELTAGQWFALGQWINADKHEDGWRPDPRFKKEAKWVWNFASFDYQRTLEDPEVLFGELLQEELESFYPGPDDSADLDEELIEQVKQVGAEFLASRPGGLQIRVTEPAELESSFAGGPYRDEQGEIVFPANPELNDEIAGVVYEDIEEEEGDLEPEQVPLEQQMDYKELSIPDEW